jgi:hypothetical protein
MYSEAIEYQNTSLSTKSVEGTTRTLEGVDDVESRDSFSAVYQISKDRHEDKKAAHRLACSV